MCHPAKAGGTKISKIYYPKLGFILSFTQTQYVSKPIIIFGTFLLLVLTSSAIQITCDSYCSRHTNMVYGTLFKMKIVSFSYHPIDIKLFKFPF